MAWFSLIYCISIVLFEILWGDMGMLSIFAKGMRKLLVYDGWGPKATGANSLSFVSDTGRIDVEILRII